MRSVSFEGIDTRINLVPVAGQQQRRIPFWGGMITIAGIQGRKVSSLYKEVVSKGDERRWKCFESKIRDKIAKVFFIIEFERIEFELSECCLFFFLFFFFNVYFILNRYLCIGRWRYEEGFWLEKNFTNLIFYGHGARIYGGSVVVSLCKSNRGNRKWTASCYFRTRNTKPEKYRITFRV